MKAMPDFTLLEIRLPLESGKSPAVRAVAVL
jgi:hypothetical protein